MIVRVPASSANVGPGFDALGMALSLYAEIGLVADGVPADAQVVDAHHPAAVAFGRCGGSGEIWQRCAIPIGRGLGFSGAVRVGGALLARAQRDGATALGPVVRAQVLDVVSDLEGHADNVAASLFGGVVATAGGKVVQVPLALDPAIVVWIPSFVTKTDESRRALGGPVSFDDAVFNVGRVALLVAALAAGDVDALRVAVDDRLHQPSRLRGAKPSQAALDAALAAGAWCAWLSGSGPTVAAMCPIADAPALAAALSAELSTELSTDGHTKVVRIDHEGATILGPYT